MTDAVTIRPAGPADASTVDTLVREIAAHEGDTAHVTVTAARWAELLGRDDVTVLLAERTGEPLGYVSALRRVHLWSGRDILALDDLWVRAYARDAGVGRALMLALARTAADDGLVIRWEVKPDNAGAQRFYQRLGAGLFTKVIAGWRPDSYLPLLSPETDEAATPA
ncbi:GNAT family N-acetyltransferase [Micromonospora sp. DR5-3]|uniref:GNAT family N-acetyltransferase n=1 Tax=unclassified Micromonospora TaxID=2617518 RepID=UPI0011D4C688|nr:MULTISPECIES: GNAT family N-acetyltransferase [unclassified Micromonospora]MCW3816619.1 GNAT family N-acetyltransferase [Micromonospora sp. DR5-3]TYC23036.1 GNAT family N-acetyltransferase [Micromonospora sp. MP36]